MNIETHMMTSLNNNHGPKFVAPARFGGLRDSRGLYKENVVRRDSVVLYEIFRSTHARQLNSVIPKNFIFEYESLNAVKRKRLYHRDKNTGAYENKQGAACLKYRYSSPRFEIDDM